MLDNVRSAYNVGAVFRTADALAIEKIWLCGITATPHNKEIAKTALGATQSVNWQATESTLETVEQLISEGWQVWGVEQTTHSTLLHEFRLANQQQKIALVFGHEVNGVDPQVLDLCHGCIEIPQFGTKHSLNIAVSAGMVLWELVRQQLIKQ